jgi:RNA polymerase sigma-70 factor (ECF subfamily)
MRDQEFKTIKDILSGNERAFSVLVDRYKEKGMGLAMRMLKDREEAEEALQDGFVRAYRGLATFQGTASFGTWFYRILFNVCHSRLESRKERLIRADADESVRAEEWVSDEPLPDAVFDSNEFRNIVTEEIDRIPEPFASTFILFAMKELRYEEIAEIVGVPMGTVKARIFRARGMLRTAIIRRLGSELGLLSKNEGRQS